MNELNKRRYRIEASIPTLERFCNQVRIQGGERADSFIHRVTPDRNEEYYYVVLSATNAVHKALKNHRFTDSISVFP